MSSVYFVFIEEVKLVRVHFILVVQKMLRAAFARAALQIRAMSSIPDGIKDIKPNYTKVILLVYVSVFFFAHRCTLVFSYLSITNG